MTESEIVRFQRRLAAQFPDVPESWIAAVIDNAIDLIGRSGAVPGSVEIEALTRQCLRMRESLV